MPIQPYQYQAMRERTERNRGRYPLNHTAADVQDEISELHGPILNWCRTQQPTVPYAYSNPTKRTRGTPGCPDFIIGYKGRTYWIECKSATGELRPDQAAFIRMLADQGIIAAVVTNMEQFYELVK